MRITPINNQRTNNKPAFGKSSKINILLTDIEKKVVPIVKKIDGEVISKELANKYIMVHNRLQYPIQ